MLGHNFIFVVVKINENRSFQALHQISSRIRASREDLLDSSTTSRKSTTVKLTVPYGTLGASREVWATNVESADREKFDATLEKVLGELEPIALQEQLFCINFFQLDVLSPTGKNTQTTLYVEDKSSDETMDLSECFFISNDPFKAFVLQIPPSSLRRKSTDRLTKKSVR